MWSIALLTVSTCKISIVRRCCAPFGEQPHVRPRTRTIKETPALQAAIAEPTRRTGPTSRADAEVNSRHSATQPRSDAACAENDEHFNCVLKNRPCADFFVAGSRINPQHRHSA